MPVQLFRLRGVPDDEVAEIRTLLKDRGIDFYETPSGNWGMSMPAIWLKDEDQLQLARSIIENYQSQRSLKVREEYEQLKQEDKQITLLDFIKHDPIRFVVYVAIILTVLYFSTMPFIGIRGN